LRAALPGDLAEAFDKSSGSFSRKLGTALARRAGTRFGEDGLHIVRAGEFRRAVRWKLELGSTECEFVSLVSLYNPSAGKIRGEKNTERAETNSTNSQTHTPAGNAPAELAKLLEDPPGWLAEQLAKCRDNPHRWVKPTCSTIAYQVYGTAARWEEVKPFVEGALR
jgi:hypothetical protein